MDTRNIYKALDLKHRDIVKMLCPVVTVDGEDWYDTSGIYLTDTRLYLESRGILIINPNNCALWRLKHEAHQLADTRPSDARRALGKR